MVNEIAKVISEGFKLLSQHQSTKAVRHMKAALEAGEEYIHANEAFGKYKDMKADERSKVKDKARRKFFKYN